MADNTLYEILGVSPKVNDAELKKVIFLQILNFTFEDVLKGDQAFCLSRSIDFSGAVRYRCGQ